MFIQVGGHTTNGMIFLFSWGDESSLNIKINQLGVSSELFDDDIGKQGLDYNSIQQ